MIKQAYISFETAKLLKDKWFSHIDEEDKDSITQAYIHAYVTEDKEVWGCYHPDYYPCVNQSLAARWIREVHNLNVEVYRTAAGYIACIVKIPSGTDLKFLETDGDDLASGTYTTYEKALEAGIQYCLKELIN